MNKNITWIIIAAAVVLIIGGIWYTTSQQNLISNLTENQSSQNAITNFSFASLNPPVSGTINDTDYTVKLTVPKNTNIKALAPTIVVSDNATISPASGEAQDFSTPVTYTVRAEDGSTQNYEVIVSTAGTSVQSTTPALSLAAALKIYANRRIQFNENCVPTPYLVTFKRGTTIMLHNESSKAKTISLDNRGYYIKAYGFALVTLTTNATLPHNISVDCGTGQNNATIYLVQ